VRPALFCCLDIKTYTRIRARHSRKVSSFLGQPFALKYERLNASRTTST